MVFWGWSSQLGFKGPPGFTGTDPEGHSLKSGAFSIFMIKPRSNQELFRGQELLERSNRHEV